MKRSWQDSSNSEPPFSLVYSATAKRNVSDLYAWWLENHGEAQSPVVAALASAERAIVVHPYQGYRTRRAGLRKLALGTTGFFVIFSVHPRLREVRIAGVLHGDRAQPWRAREPESRDQRWPAGDSPAPGFTRDRGAATVAAWSARGVAETSSPIP